MSGSSRSGSSTLLTGEPSLGRPSLAEVSWWIDRDRLGEVLKAASWWGRPSPPQGPDPDDELNERGGGRALTWHDGRGRKMSVTLTRRTDVGNGEP